MRQYIGNITLMVKDYDEAIEFYTRKLNFKLLEDKIMSANKRWVVIAPCGARECGILLAKASNNIQAQYIGNQSGGRVFLFLYTDNFDRDYNNLIEKEVKIVREPLVEEYGKVAVFADLYGNLWDLIQPS